MKSEMMNIFVIAGCRNGYRHHSPVCHSRYGNFLTVYEDFVAKHRGLLCDNIAVT